MRLLLAAGDSTVYCHLVMAIVLVTAGGVLSGLAPLALKALLDEVSSGSVIVNEAASPVGSRSISTLVLFASGYIAALAGARVLTALRPWPAGAAEQRLNVNLARIGFDRILDLPLTGRLAQAPGAAAHALDQAIAGCQILVAHAVGSVVPVAVELATVIGVLVHLEQPLIIAVFVGSALLYVTIQASAAPRTVQRAQAVSGGARSVRASLTEGLSQPESVKALGLEQAVRIRLVQALSRLERGWRALYQWQVRLSLVNAGCIAVCVAGVLALAIAGVRSGTLTQSGYVLINLYLLQLLRPLEILGNATRDMAQALGFMRPLIAMIGGVDAPRTRCAKPADDSGNERSVVGLQRAPVSLAQGGLWPAPALRLRGVRFGYDPSRPLLSDIDLDIPAGSLLAVVGASGSGKSTLLRVLLRLIEPQAGTVLIDGVPLSAVSLSELQATTGVVLQDNLLVDDTIAANIAFGCPSATRSDVIEAAWRAQLHPLIDTLPDRYETRIGDRGTRLSGGERQRVAIARALVRFPRLLLLDEATSMLDTVTERAVLRAIRHAQRPCTTIVIAHRLSSVTGAPQIAVMDAGRIVERGSHLELLARGGAYARLWQAQGPADDAASRGQTLLARQRSA